MHRTNNNSHGSEHHRNHQASPKQNDRDVLADRVLRISKTLIDLRERLAIEKELLEKEKMMTASMFMIPTTNGYYTLDYSRGQNENIQRQAIPPEGSSTNYQAYYGHDVSGESIVNGVAIQHFDQNLLEKERKMSVLSGFIRQYKQHLSDVGDKCNEELGEVQDSIYNLKKVSTELSLEMNNDYSDAEQQLCS